MKKASNSLATILVITLSFLSFLHFPAAVVLGAETELPAQRGQDARYRWNLAEIYPSQAAVNADLKTIREAYLPKLKQYEGKLNNAKTLFAFFKLEEKASRKLEKLYLYSHLMQDLNIENEYAANLCARVEKLSADYSSAVSYVEPEILSLSAKSFQKLTKEESLSDYARYLKSLYNQKAHALSKKEEALLARLSAISSDPKNIYDNASVGDFQPNVVKDPSGQEQKITENIYFSQLEHPNRPYRKKVFEAFMGSYDQMKNTSAATLFASVKKDELLADVRNYKSGLDAALSADFIPESVFNNLLSSVNSKLHYLHKYIELRKKVMDVEKVHAYDMYVPLVPQTIVQEMKFPFHKAKETILEGLELLGPEYTKKVKYGFSHRWIDVYPREKKAKGAYNWGTYDTHPFILLNYNGSLKEMLTIAHEMGHAMNSVYTNESQPYFNAGQSIFTAEVASTANELIIMDYLINKSSSDDEKLYLINEQIDAIRGTVYFQTMYSEFEKTVHEKVRNGENLTAHALNELWENMLKKYHGPFYEVDHLGALGWSRIPHFYNRFYVYKYATSMAAAFELVKQMKEDKTGKAKERYIALLSAGTSDYPIKLLKKAGVDMTSPQPVTNILEYFNYLVNEMETILKKQGRI